eukprot:5018094-Amphidinium_carterae.3
MGPSQHNYTTCLRSTQRVLYRYLLASWLHLCHSWAHGATYHIDQFLVSQETTINIAVLSWPQGLLTTYTSTKWLTPSSTSATGSSSTTLQQRSTTHYINDFPALEQRQQLQPQSTSLRTRHNFRSITLHYLTTSTTNNGHNHASLHLLRSP